MDRVLAMQAFIRVVDTGSFTAAAEALGMPKATLTRGVQELEAHLRTQLLNRTTRRVGVTPDGALYYERASRLLAELDELEGSLNRQGRTPHGKLRVDLPGSIGRSMIIPALPDFYARYPDIQLELGVSDRPVDLLAERVDCVLRGGEISDPTLVARRIGAFELLVCATPRYLERHGTPTHPAQLNEARFPVVQYFSARTGQVIPDTLRRGEEVVEVRGQARLAVNDGDAYMAAALADLGVMVGASVMVEPLLASGQLVRLFPDWELERIPLYIAFPPNRHLSTRLRVFVDWVVELMGQVERMQR
ncbi:LysR family transcriptional regulator [Inhella proteolytica]|uniref:LysR family transcriptional regulator n=1 Tax=Inhella proteolytica TaxID=2795029 RepID=A0A931J588_9BURK|nr:LysR family transcriptional regulator [Inhella proteolytica]MBH9577092.1 LysR family transcriptional regulator [Inhella proteolytica]